MIQTVEEKLNFEQRVWNKKFFNIPAGDDFACALIRGLEKRLKGQGRNNPDRFADCVIIMNNARSKRRLEEKFYEKRINILPRIGLVTDLSFLVNGFVEPAKKLTLESKVEKLLNLESLISSYLKEIGYRDYKKNSFELASVLDKLFREMVLSGLDLDAFDKVDSMNLSNHWQQSLGFIKIVEQYKSNLEKQNTLDQESFNLSIIELIEKEWKICPPKFPIIVAGSTGSRYPTSRLMNAVINLPEGYVVLPGLDNLLSDSEWKQVKPDHPQYSFKKLFNFINNDNIDNTKIKLIKNWTADRRTKAVKSRAKFLSFMMLPASHIGKWYDSNSELKPILASAFEDVSIIESSSDRQESENIALAIRINIQNQKSVSLVTDDKKLAKMVSIALKKWGIVPDNSFGEDPLQTLTSRFIRLILDFQCSKFDIVKFLALLKHPLCLNGNRTIHLNCLRQIEVKFLRGNFFELDIHVLQRVISSQENEVGKECEFSDWYAWVNEVIEAKIFLNKKRNSNQLKNHLESFEHLLGLFLGVSRTKEKSNGKAGEKIWKTLISDFKTDGIEIGKLFDDLRANFSNSKNLSLVSFRALVLRLIKDLHIPSGTTYTSNKAYIWGTLESRTQVTDVCILGGLNEGTWPRRLLSDFWLNLKMRRDIGLSSHEHTVGLAAHDFQNAFLMKSIILSRSVSSKQGDTIASRWIFRLEKLLEGLGLEGKEVLSKIKKGGNDLKQTLSFLRIKEIDELQVQIDNSVGSRPCPITPVSVRPRIVSISSFINLINNPYAVYAREILKLRRIDPVYRPFDAKFKGTFFHELMRKFISDTLSKVKEEDLWLQHFIDLGLQDISKKIDNPRVSIRIKEELSNKAQDLVLNERKRRTSSIPVGLEVIGEKVFLLSSGYTIKLTAKADRIDFLGSDETVLIDYKSSKPLRKDFEFNLPQLDLEALLASSGCFEGIKERDFISVAVIVMGAKADELRREVGSDYLEKVQKNFLNIMERVFSEDWGYGSKLSGITNYEEDYDHLARYGEWLIHDKPYKQKLKTTDSI